MKLPREIRLMGQIAKRLKIWFQEHPDDKRYPSGTVALRFRNGISLKLELQVLFGEVLTWLRVNDNKEIACSLKRERDSFLSGLQAVEQAIERGDNPPFELIELRSKITGLIGMLEHTAKVLTDNLTPEKEQNAKRIIAAILISLIMILLFEFFVYRGSVTWLKNHPRSYGIQGSVIFLIPCLIFGFFKPAWRKWCWGTASLAFLALILSLLGGRTR